ncbi:MAG: hypothetical protein ABSC06_03625 [Rhodopila sp.]|jgi:hypothetical protein
MSEDVDFKIVPPPAPVSRNAIQRALGKFGDQVTQTLHAAGFAFDPKKARTRSQTENRDKVWQLRPHIAGQGGCVRRSRSKPPCTIRLASVSLRVSSFMVEAKGWPAGSGDDSLYRRHGTARSTSWWCSPAALRWIWPA